MAKKGPPLGRVRGKHAKKHQNFRTPRNRSVGARMLRMPGGSGFETLTARAIYKSLELLLVVKVTSKKREDNNGPGILLTQTHKWNRAKNEDGSVRRLLDETLAETAGRIGGRQLPEKGMFLDKCVPTGDEGAFMQKVCAVCKCWYCELSDP